MDEPKMNTHNATMGFGKHRDKLITRIPVNYLKWCVSEGVNGLVYLQDGSEVLALDAARAEIARRGEREERVSISAHAIDRMSLRFLRVWEEYRLKDEGLRSFMERCVYEICETKVKNPRAYVEMYGDEPGKFEHCGMRWVIKLDMEVPVLLTVVECKDDGKGTTPDLTDEQAAAAPPKEPVPDVPATGDNFDNFEYDGSSDGEPPF
jgi:hypothetical protein